MPSWRLCRTVHLKLRLPSIIIITFTIISYNIISLQLTKLLKHLAIISVIIQSWMCESIDSVCELELFEWACGKSPNVVYFIFNDISESSSFNFSSVYWVCLLSLVSEWLTNHDNTLWKAIHNSKMWLT